MTNLSKKRMQKRQFWAFFQGPQEFPGALRLQFLCTGEGGSDPPQRGGGGVQPPPAPAHLIPWWVRTTPLRPGFFKKSLPASLGPKDLSETLQGSVTSELWVFAPPPACPPLSAVSPGLCPIDGPRQRRPPSAHAHLGQAWHNSQTCVASLVCIGPGISFFAPAPALTRVSSKWGWNLCHHAILSKDWDRSTIP